MGERSSSSLFSRKKEVKRSVFARERATKGNGVLGLNYLASQLSQEATTVLFATTGSSTGTEWLLATLII